MLKKVLVLLIASTVILTGCSSSNNKESNGNQTDTKVDEVKTDDEKEKKEETNKDNEKTSIVEGLSDDLYSFQFSLDGKIYTLPCEFKQFQDNGWKIEDYSEEFKLAPNQYSIGTYITKDDMSLSAGFINFTRNELNLDQCSIGQINIDEYLEDEHVDFMLPKGIKVGSTREEVMAAYGSPSDSFNGEYTDDLTYSRDSYIEIMISIDNKTNKVCEIELENLTKSDDNSLNEVNDSDLAEMPDDMPSYSAPSELTDDLFSFNVRFAGDLYTLPAPISAFLDNGWIIDSSYSKTVAAKDTIINGVRLRKDNVSFEGNVYNPSSKETAVANCYITSLISSDYSGIIDIVLPKNVSFGSTQAEVESAYKGIECEIEDSPSYIGYNYGKTYEHSIYIVVDKETGKVSKIEMNNYMD